MAHGCFKGGGAAGSTQCFEDNWCDWPHPMLQRRLVRLAAPNASKAVGATGSTQAEATVNEGAGEHAIAWMHGVLTDGCMAC
eukprot:177787-Chlamydomonas_euryale.AAC.10